MKKAILVEFNIMTRIIVDDDGLDDNALQDLIIQLSKPRIAHKVDVELGEHLVDWYDDDEIPYDENDPLTH